MGLHVLYLPPNQTYSSTKFSVQQSCSGPTIEVKSTFNFNIPFTCNIMIEGRAAECAASIGSIVRALYVSARAHSDLVLGRMIVFFLQIVAWIVGGLSLPPNRTT